MIEYTRLEVWRRAHALALEVYRVSRLFPSEERFCLTVQLRRAVISVPSTIVEGSARASDRAFASLVDVAGASAAEVEYQLRLANDLGFMVSGSHEPISHEARELRAMLRVLYNRLRSDGGRRG